MSLIEWLRVLTIASAAYCLAALVFQVICTLSFGRGEYLSAPRGNARNGIIYSFGRGMLEKESVALHRPTFVGGILYHGAILAGLLYIFWTALLPDSGPPLRAFRPVFFAGAAIGLGLFVKRAAKPILLLSSILLFVYIPFGKIRHCFFFFYTRFVFGLHFGRRGALPGSSREA